ncbi:MAG: polysaccharide biosynthesis tyrosine autokinase [Thermodesulfobacteriota bacterium]|nr:polysaccharide biosynthesis tyrosine autokinase [Thermodesulfobacteriota bacterium]
MSKLKKALEKAKAAREGEGPLFDEGPGIEEAADIRSEEAVSSSEDVKPSYKQTQVLEADYSFLREKKITALFPQEAAADQIRFLRTRVLKRMKEPEANSLLVTSPNQGEGKTLTAVNLAISISQEIGRTVLLVDADLRRPSVHKYFGFKVKLGLADYLLGKADIPDLLVNPGIEKLTIIPGGRPLPNSTELLGAPRMEALIKQLKGRYSDRFIIFDSSPVLTCADPIVFSNFIDGVIIVVEAEKTSRKELTNALEFFKDKPVLGTVLNKVKSAQNLAYV